jgi:hypothetical protein
MYKVLKHQYNYGVGARTVADDAALHPSLALGLLSVTTVQTTSRALTSTVPSCTLQTVHQNYINKFYDRAVVNTSAFSQESYLQ